MKQPEKQVGQQLPKSFKSIAPPLWLWFFLLGRTCNYFGTLLSPLEQLFFSRTGVRNKTPGSGFKTAQFQLLYSTSFRRVNSYLHGNTILMYGRHNAVPANTHAKPVPFLFFQLSRNFVSSQTLLQVIAVFD